MQTPSPRLSAHLAQQMQADMQALTQAQNDMAEAVQHQTSQLLKQHEASMRQLSHAAVRTTERAIAQNQQALNKMHSQHVNRLRWALLWPLAATVILAMLILAATTTWAWFRLDQLQTEEAQMRARIAHLEREFCTSPAGRATCKPLN